MISGNLLYIGERLRSERARLGLSQGAVAEICGINKATPSTWEKGSQTPNAAVLAVLAGHGFDVLFITTGVRAFDPSTATHPHPADTLPARLEQERKRLGLTLGQLADKAGVERLAVQKWEEGEFPPTAPELQRLHAAGVDVAYVLLALGVGATTGTVATDEEALLRTYRAAPNDQAKTTARNVLAAAVDSFLPAK
jgi:transcriptional regulator with XRE-family HTH domain